MTDKEKMIRWCKISAGRHDPYIWGAQGEHLKNISIPTLLKMETSVDNACRVVRYVYQQMQSGYDMNECRCFDCSGLMVYCLQKLGIIEYDYTAQGLFDIIKNQGKLRSSLSEIKRGDLIFRSTNGKIVHVGLYIGNNQIVEAKGRDYGVCITNINNARWDYCGDIF